ncbi:MAG: LysE family transporter [Chloroflexi bacterium]|nr:LysE family transporter [Chloroflexota bacterium]
MEMALVLNGLIIGFAIAAPVGPIGVLCIRRTLADGRVTGLLCGLGAATADALYACVAGFGLTAVSSLRVSQQWVLRVSGGAFLLYLGIRTFAGKPARTAAQASGAGLMGAYLSTLALTLTNPATIITFAVIFAGLGVAQEARGNYAAAAMLVLGVFFGSALWWLILSGGVSLLQSRFTPQNLRWVNRLSGAVIAGLGLIALVSVIQ